MARENGTGGWQSLEDMVRFADAVAAAEREACAKLCEAHTTDINIAAGVIDRFGLVRVDPHYASRHAGTKYAAAIRGRGEQVKEK